VMNWCASQFAEGRTLPNQGAQVAEWSPDAACFLGRTTIHGFLAVFPS